VRPRVERLVETSVPAVHRVQPSARPEVAKKVQGLPIGRLDVAATGATEDRERKAVAGDLRTPADRDGLCETKRHRVGSSRRVLHTRQVPGLNAKPVGNEVDNAEIAVEVGPVDQARGTVSE
jgi:hypothetical protein